MKLTSLITLTAFLSSFAIANNSEDLQKKTTLLGNLIIRFTTQYQKLKQDKSSIFTQEDLEKNFQTCLKEAQDLLVILKEEKLINESIIFNPFDRDFFRWSDFADILKEAHLNAQNNYGQSDERTNAIFSLLYFADNASTNNTFQAIADELEEDKPTVYKDLVESFPERIEKSEDVGGLTPQTPNVVENTKALQDELKTDEKKEKNNLETSNQENATVPVMRPKIPPLDLPIVEKKKESPKPEISTNPVAPSFPRVNLSQSPESTVPEAEEFKETEKATIVSIKPNNIETPIVEETVAIGPNSRADLAQNPGQTDVVHESLVTPSQAMQRASPKLSITPVAEEETEKMDTQNPLSIVSPTIPEVNAEPVVTSSLPEQSSTSENSEKPKYKRKLLEFIRNRPLN